MPSRYAPLRGNGAGLQGVYLTRVDDLLAGLLIDLIGSEARGIVLGWKVGANLVDTPLVGQVLWEEHQLDAVRSSSTLEQTEKLAIVLARRGQGLFRARVAAIERKCRITGVANGELLRASHSKPWRDATNDERLDGENGLMLTPDVDLLFDRGFLSFEGNGDVLVSPVVHMPALAKMGLTHEMLKNVGNFSDGQKQYLEFHRKDIFLKSIFS